MAVAGRYSQSATATKDDHDHQASAIEHRVPGKCAFFIIRRKITYVNFAKTVQILVKNKTSAQIIQIGWPFAF